MTLIRVFLILGSTPALATCPGLEGHSYTRDAAVAVFLNHHLQEQGVALLIGHSNSKVDSSTHLAIASELGRLAPGAPVLFDADATTAPFVLETIESFALRPFPLSAGRSHLKGAFVIQNPFIRMAAFHLAPRVIGYPDSPAGIAALLNGLTMVWRGDVESQASIVDFRRKLSPPKVTDGTSPRPRRRRFKLLDTPLPSDPSSPGEVRSLMGPGPLKTVERGNRLLRDGMKALDSLQGPRAVVFGSSDSLSRYLDFVYEAGFTLGMAGFSVTTGGGQGLMEEANAGAFDAGGVSIGIGMRGHKKEKVLSVHTHTHTFWTDGYATRIPLLLYRQNLIVVAPGGPGTLNEIAATLIAIGNNGFAPKIVFLDTEYYHPVRLVLERSGLADSVRQAVHWVDDSAELRGLLGDQAQ